MNEGAWLRNRLTLYIFGGILVFLTIAEICYSFYNYDMSGRAFNEGIAVFILGLIIIFFTCLISIIIQLILCKKEGRSFGNAFVVILVVTITSFLVFFSNWCISIGVVDFLANGFY